MPKGALLHAHLDATVNAEFLWELALQQPALHVRAPGPINLSNLGSMRPEFKALPRDQLSDTASITDASYDGTWVSIQNAKAAFDASLGGSMGFDKWVIGSMTINPAEAYNTHNTITKVRRDLTRNPFLAKYCPQDMAEIYKYIPCVSCTFPDRCVRSSLTSDITGLDSLRTYFPGIHSSIF
jgi:hypothetical protein